MRARAHTHTHTYMHRTCLPWICAPHASLSLSLVRTCLGPAWFIHQTFNFNVINENDADITIKDSDVSHDDMIGQCRASFAKAGGVGQQPQQGGEGQGEGRAARPA